MRIALIGLRLDARSRSHNIACALKSVDAAADCDPAPEMIVLPTGCDRVRREEHRQTEAMSEMYRAALSRKARDWGIIIVVGRRNVSGDEASDEGIVLDADGDLRMTIASGSPPPSPMTTVFGAVRVLVETDADRWCTDTSRGDASRANAPADSAMATIILGRPASSTCGPDDGQACRELAEHESGFTCLLRAGFGEGDPSAAVSDAARLTSTKPIKTGTIFAIEVASPTEMES